MTAATTERGQWLAHGALAVAWGFAYAANEVVWTALARALGLDLAEPWVASVHFFVYDTLKIALLLTGVIFVVAVLRSFMSVERTRALLSGKGEAVGIVLAALLGVVTPFCSCSSIPVFIGFVAAGIPLSVTMTFLIASPLVSEIAVALLVGMFGPGPAMLYLVSGLVISMVAGTVIGRLRLERWVEPFVFEATAGAAPAQEALRMSDRFAIARAEVADILGRIWPYLLAGIGVGALIHGWAPTDFFGAVAGRDNPFGVLVAVAIGVPLYANAAGILPLVEALYAKGMPMGTLLAFMMATIALSLPELIILRRVLKPPLIAVFVLVTSVAIMATGYLFNAILP